MRRPPVSLDEVVYPTGMAVLTWLVALTLAGYVLGVGSVTIPGLLEAALLGLLVWPIVAVAPWRGGVSARLRSWVVEKRATILLTVALSGLTAAVVAFDGPALLRIVLRFPVDTVGFYGMAAVARDAAGPAAAAALLAFARIALQATWLYLLATVAVGLRRGPGGVSP